MAETPIPTTQREFRCVHCNGKILIPWELPPTTGPCPHCSGTITSPAADATPPAPALSSPVKSPPPHEVATPAPAAVVPIVVEVPVSSPAPAAHAPAIPAAPANPAAPVVAETPPPVPAPSAEPSPSALDNAPGPGSVLSAIAAAAAAAAVESISSRSPETAPAPQAPADPRTRPESIQPQAPTGPAALREPVAIHEPQVPADLEMRKAVIPEPRVRATPPPPPVDGPPATPEESAVEIPSKADHSELNKPKRLQNKPVKPQRSGLIPAMLVLLTLILLGGGIVIFASKQLGRNQQPPTLGAAVPRDPAVNEANYIRIGWQKDALQLLKNYVGATTVQEKLPYVLHAQELATRMEDFYGGGVINDNDTLPEAFSVYELSEEDRKRGLFMMIYDQPPQFDMKEFFRPLASLEVQYGVDEADLLLSTLARVGNFAMEPLRVHAFFKRTPEGLKLDWEVFAQTKYRTLQNFVELPEVGHSGIFRVFVVEDVPDKGKAVAGTRTYRVADPANTTDTARINVKVDSEAGRSLSLINWRNTKENRPITKTATVELKWTGEPNAPELEIHRFLCWEFLGLGGNESSSTVSTK